MNRRRPLDSRLALLAVAALAVSPVAFSQVPVDDDGKPVGSYAATDELPALGDEDIPLMSATELEDLVGPIALYPDDLLAIVLPAATYPLQVIEAGRFLEELEEDPALEPNPDWDDSVVALLNYPEVVELMNEDIDWTWRLGEAVVAQQEDVVGAVETFRDRAYAAGNLRSDDYQKVERHDGVIEIKPVSDDVIYVPYYEPERVVVYQPRPVYYYYPRAYPVYYYPYPSYYDFDRGFFWGVTTAFTIGWVTDSLHVYHHSYRGHPYFGYRYWDNWWYRQPSINVYNTTYIRNTNVTVNHHYRGDRWHPRHNRREYIRETRPRVINHQRSVREARLRHDRGRAEPRREIRFRSRPETAPRQRPANATPMVRQRAEQREQRREPVARQRTQQRVERREPVARQRAVQREQRREPAARQRTEQRAERREPVARQRAERRVEHREPVARQRTEQRVQRREPVARQRTEQRVERREPVARQHVEQRRTAAPQRREARPEAPRSSAKRSESKPARSKEDRRSESRSERGKARRTTR